MRTESLLSRLKDPAEQHSLLVVQCCWLHRPFKVCMGTMKCYCMNLAIKSGSFSLHLNLSNHLGRARQARGSLLRWGLMLREITRQVHSCVKVLRALPLPEVQVVCCFFWASQWHTAVCVALPPLLPQPAIQTRSSSAVFRAQLQGWGCSSGTCGLAGCLCSLQLPAPMLLSLDIT